MREILFRAKRLSDGEWIDGSLFIDEKKDKHEILIGYVNYRIGWEVDSETVGQFTGLTDKNGKKIFEGDIVVHEVQKGILFNKGVINWDAKNARWAHQLNTMNPCLCMFDSSTHEVIGNIHDNPELLEAQS